MPITDPIPDEDIRDGFSALNRIRGHEHHHHHHGHHHQSQTQQPVDTVAVQAQEPSPRQAKQPALEKILTKAHSGTGREEALPSASGARPPEAIKNGAGSLPTAAGAYPPEAIKNAAEGSSAPSPPQRPPPEFPVLGQRKLSIKPPDITIVEKSKRHASPLETQRSKTLVVERPIKRGPSLSINQLHSTQTNTQPLDAKKGSHKSLSHLDKKKAQEGKDGKELAKVDIAIEDDISNEWKEDDSQEGTIEEHWAHKDHLRQNPLEDNDRAVKHHHHHHGVVDFKHLFSPTFWLERHYYKVGANLKNDWRIQAIFFGKVILLKMLQLLIINSWILTVGLIPVMLRRIVENNDWMYMSLILFLVMLMFVRITAKWKAGWHPAFSIILLFFLTFAIAYALASVTFTYEAYCIPMATVSLFLTFLTLPFVPFMTQSSATKPAVIRTGAVLVVLYSVLILIIVAYAKLFPDMTYFATLVWFPGMLMAEIVLWVTVYEIQRILQGYSFNVSHKRWAFTALYI